jgi:hypothetical protein
MFWKHLYNYVWFPDVIVHPVLEECATVDRPSWVATKDPSIFFCHSNDFCCSWTHPKSFSLLIQVWLRIPSRSSCIFVVEAVTLGGCLTIKGRGFGSQVVSSLESVLRSESFIHTSWVPHSLSNSKVLICDIEGSWSCADCSCCRWRMKTDITGWRHLTVGFPSWRSRSLSNSPSVAVVIQLTLIFSDPLKRTSIPVSRHLCHAVLPRHLRICNGPVVTWCVALVASLPVIVFSSS